MKEEFKIKAMGFGELAQKYCPNVTPRSACNALRRWINIHPTLISVLKDSGYQKYCRILTPKQVELIVEHLGEP